MVLPKYAFFDFDGTLIVKDSFRLLLRNALRQSPLRLFLMLFSIPVLLATIIFKIDKMYVKSFVIWSLTFGKSKRDCVRFLRNSVANESSALWFQQAFKTIEDLKKDGIEVVLVTASGQIWVRAMIPKNFHKFKIVIGSKLGFFAGGVILKSKNCYHSEKIKRIHQALGKNFIWHSAWSDHIADLPMLTMANQRYIICPKDKHIPIFTERLQNNFTILKWNVQ